MKDLSQDVELKSQYSERTEFLSTQFPTNYAVLELQNVHILVILRNMSKHCVHKQNHCALKPFQPITRKSTIEEDDS